MKKSATLAFVALGLAALVAAGCSGSGTTAISSSTPTPVPLPTGSCSPPPGETIQEVFPQNGASAAPNLQGVVFAVAPNPLPTNWYFYVTNGVYTTQGTAQIGFLATPSPQPTVAPTAGATAVATGTPLPTPSDVPSSAAFGGNPIYEIASIGTFANNTKFTVYLANTTCGTGIQQSTFTTNLTDLPTPTPAPSPSST